MWQSSKIRQTSPWTKIRTEMQGAKRWRLWVLVSERWFKCLRVRLLQNAPFGAKLYLQKDTN